MKWLFPLLIITCLGCTKDKTNPVSPVVNNPVTNPVDKFAGVNGKFSGMIVTSYNSSTKYIKPDTVNNLQAFIHYADSTLQFTALRPSGDTAMSFQAGIESKTDNVSYHRFQFKSWSYGTAYIDYFPLNDSVDYREISVCHGCSSNIFRGKK